MAFCNDKSIINCKKGFNELKGLSQHDYLLHKNLLLLKNGIPYNRYNLYYGNTNEVNLQDYSVVCKIGNQDGNVIECVSPTVIDPNYLPFYSYYKISPYYK